MSISQNLSALTAAIAGRARLIAVSKNQDEEKIKEALAAGQRIFGENKVQEAKRHWDGKRQHYPDLSLHLIGALQSNKAKDAVALFNVIQTLDRKSLIDAVAREEKKQNRKLEYFIQINTGREEQKSGVLPEELTEILNTAREQNLRVTGLMCIPPVDEDPRPHFRMLKTLAAREGLSELSMGMSEDFKEAIEEGASFVRIGTRLFGAR